jgi:hypothetical protein
LIAAALDTTGDADVAIRFCFIAFELGSNVSGVGEDEDGVSTCLLRHVKQPDLERMATFFLAAGLPAEEAPGLDSIFI